MQQAARRLADGLAARLSPQGAAVVLEVLEAGTDGAAILFRQLPRCPFCAWICVCAV